MAVPKRKIDQVDNKEDDTEGGESGKDGDSVDALEQTSHVREREVYLQEVLQGATVLVKIVQEFDLGYRVHCLLAAWTPKTWVWPDPSRNPLVTRYLLQHHTSDVVIPYLDAFFAHFFHGRIMGAFGVKVGPYATKHWSIRVHKSHAILSAMCSTRLPDMHYMLQAFSRTPQNPFEIHIYGKISISPRVLSQCPLFTNVARVSTVTQSAKSILVGTFSW